MFDVRVSNKYIIVIYIFFERCKYLYVYNEYLTIDKLTFE